MLTAHAENLECALVWETDGAAHTDRTCVSGVDRTALPGGLGEALAGVALLTHTTQISHEELATRVLPALELLRYREYAQLWDLSSLKGLAAIDAEIGRQALMIGYVNAYLATAVLALALIPLALCLRQPRRRDA